MITKAKKDANKKLPEDMQNTLLLGRMAMKVMRDRGISKEEAGDIVYPIWISRIKRRKTQKKKLKTAKNISLLLSLCFIVMMLSNFFVANNSRGEFKI